MFDVFDLDSTLALTEHRGQPVAGLGEEGTTVGSIVKAEWLDEGRTPDLVFDYRASVA